MTSALTAILRTSMRPCSLSTDCAVFGTASPAGGKVAEAFGDGGLQLRLIVFHHEHVIAFPIFDGLALQLHLSDLSKSYT